MVQHDSSPTSLASWSHGSSVPVAYPLNIFSLAVSVGQSFARETVALLLKLLRFVARPLLFIGDAQKRCAWCSFETLQHTWQAHSCAVPVAKRCLGRASAQILLAVGFLERGVVLQVLVF